MICKKMCFIIIGVAILLNNYIYASAIEKNVDINSLNKEHIELSSYKNREIINEIYIDDTITVSLKIANKDEYKICLVEKDLKKGKERFIEEENSIIQYSPKVFGEVLLKLKIITRDNETEEKIIEIGTFSIETFRTIEQIPKSFKGYLHKNNLSI